MVKTYRAFIDAGAGAVIGNHTHCPQGMELYRDKPIVYSMGNFLFGKVSADIGRMWYYGYMVRLLINKLGVAGVEILPYCQEEREPCIRLLEAEDKDSFFKYFENISNIIWDKSELQNYWYGWCAKQGPEWLKMMVSAKIDSDVGSPERTHEFCCARNILSCEAHNELLSTYLDMVYKGHVALGEQYIPRIEKLQQGF